MPGMPQAHLKGALQLAGAARRRHQRVPHRGVCGDARRPGILHQPKGPLQQHQLLPPAGRAGRAQAAVAPSHNVVCRCKAVSRYVLHATDSRRTPTSFIKCQAPAPLPCLHRASEPPYLTTAPTPGPSPAHRSEGGSRLMCCEQALTTEAYTILSDGTPAAFISEYSWKALSASPAPAQAAAQVRGLRGRGQMSAATRQAGSPGMSVGEARGRPEGAGEDARGVRRASCCQQSPAACLTAASRVYASRPCSWMLT